MNSSIITTLRVFLPFTCGYFLSYLYRTVNAVIAPDLVLDLGLDPSQLGMLTSAYFIAFASFQIPLGVLLDRFGPRKIEAFLLVIASLGAFLFARSETLVGVVIGRAFIGFGVSACLMAALKAYVLWFPKDLWPRVNGFHMAAGGLGALTATAPVEAALHFTDWRGVFLVLSILTLAVAALVLFVVPEKKSEEKRDSLREQISGVGKVFTSLEFWRIAPLTAISQAAFMSIQGLWAGPWLKDVAGLPRADVGQVLLWTAAAMAAGFVITGTLAERLSKIGIRVLTTSVVGMCVFMFVQALIILEFTHWALFLWIGFGFFGSTGIIAYAALSQSFPARLSGRVTTGINLMVFVFAFAGQWTIGVIINLWPVSDAGIYATPGYQAGFLVMLALQVVSLIWFAVSSHWIEK